ncbi:MAG: polyphosphate--AMP phosphotransferase [Coriobacteriia bacterium]|nr:polyphosphate--AMP phosphotransferase [Coriobacteriia bacterium]
MLEQVNFAQEKLSKELYKASHNQLIKKLIVLQQQARSEGVGLVVLFEGWDGAGKGSRISDIMYNLDARATSVHVTKDINEDELEFFRELNQGVGGFFPPMQEFWNALGPRGNISFFVRGWYTSAIQRLIFTLFGKSAGKEDLIAQGEKEELEGLAQYLLPPITEFEQQLADDGYAVVKFFVHISQKEQKDRLSALFKDPLTQWRVSKAKLDRTKVYQQAYWLYDDLLTQSDKPNARWILVNGEDRRRANLTICAELVRALESALSKTKDGAADETTPDKTLMAPASSPTDSAESGGVHKDALSSRGKSSVLSRQISLASSRFPLAPEVVSLDTVDSNLALDAEEYRAQLKLEQERLNRLELEMFLKRIPLVVLFEGWDAAGKGGAIKRVAQALDARAYTVFPSAAPTLPEKLRPHLWRYWTRLPKAGHVGIYDRSWYGRVLVERVEGFAPAAQILRAYDELNSFELDLINWGALVLKFWVDISPEEQLKRFKEREDNPAKFWKITDEDWRNREKYSDYRKAVEDMFRLTSTAFAPWVILESNNKYYARIKALRSISDALEKRLHAANETSFK